MHVASNIAQDNQLSEAVLSKLTEVEQAQFWDDIDRCRSICAEVSGNPNVTVIIGAPGRGSFAEVNCGKVTLDPLDILVNRSFAIFVAAHEGMHVRITLDPERLGLTLKQTDELYSQIGFGFLQNLIEDAAGNDWLIKFYAGIEPHKTVVYDQMFSQNQAVLTTPEIDQLMARVGRVPLFVQFASEIMRDSHTWRKKLGVGPSITLAGNGQFSKGLDPLVRSALYETIAQARQAVDAVPTSADPSENEVLACSRNRFRIAAEELYPKISELIEKDIAFETLRQALNSFQSDSTELADREHQLEDKGLDSKQRKALQDQVDQLKRKLAGQLGVSVPALEELRDKIKQAISEQVEKLTNRLFDDLEQVDRSRARQNQLQDELDKVRKQVSEATGGELVKLQQKASQLADQLRQEEETEAQKRLEIQKRIEQSFGSRPLDPQSHSIHKEIEEYLNPSKQDQGQDSEANGESLVDRDSSAAGDGVSNKERIKIAIDQQGEALLEQQLAAKGELPLVDSPESQAALAELGDSVDNLDQQSKNTLRQRARSSLRQLEDEMVEAIEGQATSFHTPKHDEVRQRQRERSEQEQITESREPIEVESSREIEVAEAQSASARPYEKLVENLAGEIAGSRRRLKKAFKPDQEPERTSGHTSGRAEINQIRRAGSHPERALRSFSRRDKRIELDHVVAIVVDTSISMGVKAEETFKALAFTNEVLSTLKVPLGIWRFSDSVSAIRRFDDRPVDQLVQERISSCLNTHGGTHDGDALTVAWKALSKRREKFKILMIFTDAESGQPEKAKKLVSKIIQSKKALVLHFGIGPKTKDIFRIFPFTLSELTTVEKELAEESQVPDQYFFSVYTRVVEDLLKNPGKYRAAQSEAFHKIEVLENGEIIFRNAIEGEM